MSKSKRNDFGQFAKAPSKKMLIGSFIASLLSIALSYACALALWANLISFRSCNINNNGITATDCGKHGLNLGDIILLGLFILVVSMMVSICTHFYRLAKRMLSK